MSMRISTSQVYDSGIRGIQRAQNAAYKTQNQIAADTRILRPSDDPVAAAQALVVSQSKAINEQYQTNQQSAKNQLALVDTELSAVTTVLQKARDNLVKAGSTGTLTSADRESIASDLEANLNELQGLANSTDQLGDYMFSGYQGGTRPFTSDAAGNVSYSGDEGERLLQVSASRQMPVNVSGYDVFMDGKSGNGTFLASTLGNTAGGNNQGSAMIDAGSVLNPQKWESAASGLSSASTDPLLTISFATDTTTGKMQYTITDYAGNTRTEDYTDGQAISLTTSTPATLDFGAQVVISGKPAENDTFSIKPSTTQSAFQTLQKAITALRTGVNTTTYTSTQLVNDLANQMTALDLAMANVSEVQSTVGANAKEVAALTSTSEDLAIQYSSTLSDLKDLDYVEAYSTYAKQQMTLQAAQQSFTKITGKSLFDYL